MEQETQIERSNYEIMKNGLLRYYVKEGIYGFEIYEVGYSVPLPFSPFCRKNNAELCCGKLNQGGPRAVAEQYYFGNIVGNRNISDFIKRGINPYQEWINKNKDMFVREDRR